MVKRMASLHDYEDYARETLSRPLFDHFRNHRSDIPPSAIESEKVNDFNKIKLKLRGMLNLKYFEGITTTFLGCKLSSPIGLGPLPPLYDIGLVHRVKELSENKEVI